MEFFRPNPLASLAFARTKAESWENCAGSLGIWEAESNGEHSQRQEVTKLRRITAWPRIAYANNLNHTDLVEGEIDVVRCLMAQARRSFCGIATTQKISPIRR